MVKFYIVLPVYNVEKYLRECLNSIINQTYKNFEVICVNDCSEDNSLAILNEYAQKDNRIKIITKSMRDGVGIVRNTALDVIFTSCMGGGIEHSYISFIDSDDYIAPDMYEILAQKIKETPADIVCFNYVTLKNGQEYKLTPFNQFKKEYYNKKELKNIFVYDLYPTLWNKVFSAEFIEKNNLKFINTCISEDIHFNLYAKIFAQSLLILKNQYLYYYRVREKSLCNSYDKKYMQTIDDLIQIKTDLINKNIFKEYKKEFYRYINIVLNFSYNLLPENYKKNYYEKSKLLYDRTTKKEFKKLYNKDRANLEKIFSIYNHYDGEKMEKEKILQIFGKKYTISRKSL